MKLTDDSRAADGTHHITGYGEGWIEADGARHTGAVLLAPDRPVEAWPLAFDALTDDALGSLLQARPELVILGTGARQRFPHPRLLATLAAAGVGLEAMATGAACRTYNILAAEGRRVVAVLLEG